MVITPQILLNAYTQGIFPMADARSGKISWYDPNPRAILPLDGFHVPRSLLKVIKKNPFEMRYDTTFRQVMLACAEPAPDRERTWINDEIVRLYCELHQHGFAHSVESWQDGQLVGGLYGVTVGGLFAGESMFSRVTDSSKVALYYLVERLRNHGFTLLDVQFTTNHLKRFGVIDIPRNEYKARVTKAITVSAKF